MEVVLLGIGIVEYVKENKEVKGLQVHCMRPIYENGAGYETYKDYVSYNNANVYDRLYSLLEGGFTPYVKANMVFNRNGKLEDIIILKEEDK